MLLIKKGDFVLQSDRRVVKAVDVATVRSAAEIVAAAETQAAQIREDAKAAYEEERKKGYDKGIADGKYTSISRGDGSGTHTKEISLWPEELGITADAATFADYTEYYK